MCIHSCSFNLHCASLSILVSGNVCQGTLYVRVILRQGEGREGEKGDEWEGETEGGRDGEREGGTEEMRERVSERVSERVIVGKDML